MRVSEYGKLFKNRKGKEVAFFENPSWQIIEKLECYSGVWFHQNRVKNYFIRLSFVIVMISAAIPVGLRLSKELGVNLAIATENVMSLLILGSSLIKLFTCCTHNQKRQKIYEKVNEHFRTIVDPEEAYVLKKSAEQAKKFCINYMRSHLTTGVIFFLLPIARMVLNYLIKGELEKTLPYSADYGFIDEDKYYLPIMLHITAMASFFILTHFAHDFGYIMNVRHVCALFEIVKIRLREASSFLDEFEWDMLDSTTANTKAYEMITKAIDLHNQALEMVPLIEEAYTFCWFAVLLMNAFIFSGGAYLVLLNLHDPFNLLRYFAFFVSLFLHFSAVFVHGQMIIDSSSSIFDACYNVKWYVASPKTRKLLSIMMSRSSRPSVITGGNLFIISMETCCKMMKGGFSYLSVFTQK